MPQLEEMYQNLKAENINLIGVGTDSGESEENLETSRKILTEKGVTFQNISPDPENAFYQDFISEILPPTLWIRKETSLEHLSLAIWKIRWMFYKRELIRSCPRNKQHNKDIGNLF